MKQFIKCLWLLLSVTLSAQAQTFTIKGKVTSNDSPKKIYLKYQKETSGGESIEFLDSAVVKDGLFILEGKLSDPHVARIWYDQTGKKVVSMSEFADIYLIPGTICINSSKSMNDAEIIGPPPVMDLERLKKMIKLNENAQKISLRKINKRFREVSDPSHSIDQKQRDSIKAVLELEYNATIDTFSKRNTLSLYEFAKNNPNSQVSILALERAGKENYVLESKIFGTFSAAVKKSKAGKEFAAHLFNWKAVDIGNTAPNFSQREPDGTLVSLSDYKGKYVLIDFWASWCMPCRSENPNLVKLYNKYHSKGLEILGVSLDQYKANWIAAVKEDGLVWKQVSDLKYWKNSVAELYDVKSIPMNFLIDKEGKIIAANLRGEDVEAKIADIFKNK